MFSMNPGVPALADLHILDACSCILSSNVSDLITCMKTRFKQDCSSAVKLIKSNIGNLLYAVTRCTNDADILGYFAADYYRKLY